LILARAALDSAVPVLTGDPTITADAFARENADREQFQRLSDRELLRTAVRELAITCIVVARTLQQNVLGISTKVKETAALVLSLSTCLKVVIRGFVQLAFSSPARASESEEEQDPEMDNPLDAALRQWEESRKR
jgi:hypothetical protein